MVDIKRRDELSVRNDANVNFEKENIILISNRRLSMKNVPVLLFGTCLKSVPERYVDRMWPVCAFIFELTCCAESCNIWTRAQSSFVVMPWLRLADRRLSPFYWLFVMEKCV